MSEVPEADSVAHPDALARWRAVAGDADAVAVAWAERILGVEEPAALAEPEPKVIAVEDTA
jgi:hypothetical protein